MLQRALREDVRVRTEHADDLCAARGPDVLGRAYATLLAHDVHTEGSVDRVLWSSMVLISEPSMAMLYAPPPPVRYAAGSRPVLEARVAALCADAEDVETFLERTGAAFAAVAASDDTPIDDAVFGGTEEEILERVTDWCVDVSRATCALCQVAGFPARLVALADLDVAYSAHQIVEVYRGGAWGALDPISGVVYRYPDGRLASVRDLQRDPDLVDSHASRAAIYTRPGQFRSAAIFTYDIGDADRFDYSVSRVNDYYRSILEHAAIGWPNGLRWLHGEDA
jgi:transglutaminase-like putative cysteine protease